MSEILRAILDKNCLDSRTAFYGAQLVSPLGNSALTFGRRTASIACKSDTWFLCMGAAQDNGLVSPGLNGWHSKAHPSTFQIVRARNGEAYSIAPQLMVLQNYNLNNFVTMDEYIPFAPAELIQITEDVAITWPVANANDFVFVTLMGVEYQMPPGKGLDYGY